MSTAYGWRPTSPPSIGRFARYGCVPKTARTATHDSLRTGAGAGSPRPIDSPDTSHPRRGMLPDPSTRKRAGSEAEASGAACIEESTHAPQGDSGSRSQAQPTDRVHHTRRVPEGKDDPQTWRRGRRCSCGPGRSRSPYASAHGWGLGAHGCDCRSGRALRGRGHRQLKVRRRKSPDASTFRYLSPVECSTTALRTEMDEEAIPTTSQRRRS